MSLPDFCKLQVQGRARVARERICKQSGYFGPTAIFARTNSGGSASVEPMPVANCNSFIVRSVSNRLEATWSTSR